MKSYSQQDVLCVAKRYNNQKRPYLLVNPLQAKHMPVSPSEALWMMETLGEQIRTKYPRAKVVIGFAETATAIGAVLADCLGPDCYYIHTTREPFVDDSRCVHFFEEHSHAVEQKLFVEGLHEALSHTDTVLFAEDEISTGKTLINIIQQLKEKLPAFGEKKLIAASLLNRVSKENEERLLVAGIECEYLVKLSEDDYVTQVQSLQVTEARPAESLSGDFWFRSLDVDIMTDPRGGCLIRNYEEDCNRLATALIAAFPQLRRSGQDFLVLGTEEYMYPAIVLGRKLERFVEGASVHCHATTRSPIGICDLCGYPIVSGSKLPSFYDPSRSTYIYNQRPCDTLIILSDTQVEDLAALRALMGAWSHFGVQNVYYVQGGRNVWYIQKDRC